MTNKQGKHAHAAPVDHLQISIQASAALMLGELRKANNKRNTLKETIKHAESAAKYATRLRHLAEFKEYIGE